MIRYITILICLTTSYLCAADKFVHLQYLPNVPVLQISELKIEMVQALPGSKIDGEDRQTIKALVSIASDQPNQTAAQPPLDLLFVLKSYAVELKANGHSVQFHSEEPEKLPHQVQSYKMVDRPLRLHIDKDFNLKTDTGEFQAVFSELPALKEIHIENFLLEWFQHLFALAGKNLSIGSTFQVPTLGDQMESVITYEIKSITDQEVKADFNGQIGSKSLQLAGQIQLDGKKQSGVDMTLSGETTGNVTWNRQNALVYQFQAHHVIRGVLKIGEWAWTLSLNLTHHMESMKDEG